LRIVVGRRVYDNGTLGGIAERVALERRTRNEIDVHIAAQTKQSRKLGGGFAHGGFFVARVARYYTESALP
jgi:hypothetical protein